MKPIRKVFTKAMPCTKLEIWNAFAARGGFLPIVQVDLAHSVIGLNVPRIMERGGYLTREKGAQGDYYRLTQEGRAWLDKGIRNYLRNHPAKRLECRFPPSAETPRGRVARARVQTVTNRVSRTRPVQ